MDDQRKWDLLQLRYQRLQAIDRHDWKEVRRIDTKIQYVHLAAQIEREARGKAAVEV